MNASQYRARAFGCDWSSDVALDRFDGVPTSSSPAQFQVTAAPALPERTVVRKRGRGWICSDGFRLQWFEMATFDGYDDGRIVYTHGARWDGTLPEPLYSTVAALALVGQGALPLHATAVEWNGRAFLIMGTAGAGKSTLGAELLEAGAKLIGDDLTVIAARAPGDGFVVMRGRPMMRLHPELAARIDAVHEADPGDPRGKLLVEPRRRSADGAFPLAGVILLEHGPPAVGGGEAMRLLPRQLFRRRWCEALPGHGRRQAALLELTAQIAIRRMAPVAGFDAEARQVRVQHALEFFAGAG